MMSVANVATGETYGFGDGPSDPDVLRLDWSAVPGARVAEHVHPRQEERFAVTAGELTVALDGAERRLVAGESLAVPPGRRHWFANRGSEPVAATLEIRPALRMREVFESLAGMAREGKARPGGLPRNPLLLAVFAHEFREEIRGPAPPYWLQRALLPPLAGLGRRLGQRAHRPEYRAAA
jgi:mannose-6-phosphate isomerase-like protein (cupin superfamily)